MRTLLQRVPVAVVESVWHFLLIRVNSEYSGRLESKLVQLHLHIAVLAMSCKNNCPFESICCNGSPHHTY